MAFDEPAVSNRRLWFGLLAPPIAYVVHELASFVISSVACTSGKPSLVRPLLYLVFLIALAFATIGGVTAFGSWRTLHGEQRVLATHGSREMTALFGLLIGIVLSVGLVWAGIASSVLDVCEASR